MHLMDETQAALKIQTLVYYEQNSVYGPVEKSLRRTITLASC